MSNHKKCETPSCNKQARVGRYCQLCAKNLPNMSQKYKEKTLYQREKQAIYAKKIRIITWSWLTPDDEIKCQQCGERELEFMTITYRDGGGRKHRESMGNRGDAIYPYIINNYIKKGIRKTPFILLCANCNMCYRPEVSQYV